MAGAKLRYLEAAPALSEITQLTDFERVQPGRIPPRDREFGPGRAEWLPSDGNATAGPVRFERDETLP